MKEWKGIVFGCIAFFVVPIVIFGYLSRESIRSKTEPVFSETVESPEFKEESFNRIVRELEIKEMNGFLFKGHSQRPIYVPIFVGKSPKGSEAVRAAFPKARPMEIERVAREASALARANGGKPSEIYEAGGNGRDCVYFSGDFIILEPESKAASEPLDELQMKHFLGSCLKEK